MKILSIVHRYHSAVGGAEAFMGTVNRLLVERGHQVTVLTTDALDFELFWNRNRARFSNLIDEYEGVTIRRFPVRHLPFPRYSFPVGRLLAGQVAHYLPNSALSKKITTYFPHVPAMSRWLATTQEEFDVVLGMPITLEGIQQLGQQFAYQRKIPFVIFPLTHLGGGSAPGSEPISRFYTLPHQQQIVLLSDGLVAINPAEKAFYEARGMAAEKMIVAPPAPELAQLAGGNGGKWGAEHNVEADTPIVVTLSALTQDKGTMQTVEAMRRLWQNGSSAKLVLAGSARSDFEAYFETIPAEEKRHIILRGKISNDERKDLLAAADIFCMPSVVESFGMVFAEAMVFKTPVIGGNVWGVKDFVIRPGENGYLVEAGDFAGLAKIIERLMNDRPLAQRLGQNGYEFVMSELSWEKSVDKIEGLLKKLTADKMRG